MSSTLQQPPDPVFTFKGKMSPVHCVAFHNDDNKDDYLYVGTGEGKIHIWNLKENREVEFHKVGDCVCLSLSKIKQLVITQEKGGVYKLWQEDSPYEKWCLKAKIVTNYYGFCKGELFHCKTADLEDSLCLVCAEEGSGVGLYSISMEKQEKFIAFKEENVKNDGEVMAIKVSELQQLMFVAYESGTIKVWSLDVKSIPISKPVASLKLTDDCPMAIDVHCKGFHDKNSGVLRGVVATSGPNLLEFSFDPSEQTLVKGKEVVLTNDGVACVAIRPDGKLFTAGCWDGRLRIYSWKSLKLLAVLESHTNVVQHITFYIHTEMHSRKYLMASGSLDGKVSLWDIYN